MKALFGFSQSLVALSFQAEDLLVYLENRSLRVRLQGKFSACDNLMALRMKKVAGKRINRRFYAKNAGVVFRKFWLMTAFFCRPAAGPVHLGHFQFFFYEAAALVIRSLLHRENTIDAFGQVCQISFVAAA